MSAEEEYYSDLDSESEDCDYTIDDLVAAIESVDFDEANRICVSAEGNSILTQTFEHDGNDVTAAEYARSLANNRADQRCLRASIAAIVEWQTNITPTSSFTSRTAGNGRAVSNIR